MSGHRKSDVEPGQLPARRVAHVHAHTRVLQCIARKVLVGPQNLCKVPQAKLGAASGHLRGSAETCESFASSARVQLLSPVRPDGRLAELDK